MVVPLSAQWLHYPTPGIPRTPDGKLDLHRAPMQLLAIVNRFDLNLTEGNAGEGRFVFGVLGPGRTSASTTDDPLPTRSETRPLIAPSVDSAHVKGFVRTLSMAR